MKWDIHYETDQTLDIPIVYGQDAHLEILMRELASVDRLRAVNAELLAALEDAVPAMGVDISDIDIGAVIAKARAAIARAKKVQS